MWNLNKIVNVLIKVFLVGLLLQFLLQTFFTYKLGYHGGIWSYVWIWKEVMILLFLMVIMLLLWKKAQKIGRKSLWEDLQSQTIFRFLIFFAVLCSVSFILAILVQKVSIGTYLLSIKYDLLGFLIFLLGVFLAQLLPLETKWIRWYNLLIKGVIYGAFIWWATIAFLPSFLKLFGYSRDSFEGTLSGNPPAVYYTQINQGHARNQFLFERPISLGFFLIAFWPLFVLTYLRKCSRRDQLIRTIAFGAIVFSTYSRAALGVRVLQTGALLLLLYPKNIKQILIKIGIPAFFVFVIGVVSLRSVFARSHSNTGHVKLLVEGVQLGMKKPLTGRGAGYSGPASHQLCLNASGDARCREITAINTKYSMQTPGYNPENQYVQIFMEYGLLGLIPWMLCFGWLLRETLKLIPRYILQFKQGKKADQKQITQLLIAIAFGLGLAGLAIEGLVLHSFVDRMIVYPFMMLMGLRRGSYGKSLHSDH